MPQDSYPFLNRSKNVNKNGVEQWQIQILILILVDKVFSNKFLFELLKKQGYC